MPMRTLPVSCRVLFGRWDTPPRSCKDKGNVVSVEHSKTSRSVGLNDLTLITSCGMISPTVIYLTQQPPVQLLGLVNKNIRQRS